MPVSPKLRQTRQAEELRRSPRVNPTPATENGGNVGSSGGSGPRKVRHRELMVLDENLRRSPRLSASVGTGSSSSSPHSAKVSSKLRQMRHAEELRRSPRLSSTPATENGGNVGSSGGSGLRKVRHRELMVLEENLRRSPRLSAIVGTGSCSSSHSAKRQRSSTELPLNAVPKDQISVLNGKCTDEKSFRQSPRLTTTPFDRETACRITLPLKVCVEQMKLRKSPRLSSSNGNGNLEIVAYQEKRIASINSTPGIDNTKCLRCSSEPMKPPACVEQMKLRKSPRLSSSNGNGNLEIVAYQEKRIASINSTRGIDNTKCLRCSSEPMKPPACVEQMKLRKSPRLSSSNGNGNLEIVAYQEKRIASINSTRGIDNTKCLRCSSEPMKPPACVEQMKLRKSPRLSSSNGNGNLEIVAYQEKRIASINSTRGIDNTKCLRCSSEPMKPPACVEQMKLRKSPRLSSSNGNGNLEIVAYQEKRIASINSTPGIDNTKCLRCSSEPMKPPACLEKEQTSSDCHPLSELDDNPPRKKCKTSASSANQTVDKISTAFFIGDPIPDDEAHKRWGWRYDLKDKKCKGRVSKINEDEEDEIILNVKCHYAQANIENRIFSLGDCAFVKGEGKEKHIGRIIEFFQTTNGQNYFRVQWFYRIQDTVVKDEGGFHDQRRLFYSSVMNDNLIDSIIKKVNVTYIKPRVGVKLTSVLPSDFYYDMEYCVDYSTFRNIPTDKDNTVQMNGLSQPAVSKSNSPKASTITKSLPSPELCKTELVLLDLYSGCGGMSTGLCLGAKTSSVNLVTRWAVDTGKAACETLKLNHPDTHVINESADDFLELLKEWEKLCKRYNYKVIVPLRSKSSEAKKEVNCQAHVDDVDDVEEEELEVSSLVDICYGDPNDTGKRGLYLKVHWKGYDESEDTWEPIESLRNCKESIQDFVREGIKSKVLPLPGEVDVICGGPPCQGISGYNRFRNTESPLDDERNRQIVVFLDIVRFLKPKYVLMENVVDILKFDKGSLGRYALSRLVHMNYQARVGIVAAGCYGLPQFRLRVFVWGAHPNEVLPQFPLPTHDVIVRYYPPLEFERNTVAYDEDQPRDVEKAIVLQDAISDLPAVTNSETREEMSYRSPPETEFQRYIRSSKYEMTGSALHVTTTKRHVLYDQRPSCLSEDDYLRVCKIPKKKGANFRDLPGVVVGADNKARRHPTEKLLLPSGKSLVPDYAFNYEQGRSKRPFARLWWDETVATALTIPSCHCQAILHPEQDRILTVREFARLQGFPDYYRFCGTVKERYCQIGNAVAVPVARALGYALGMAYRKLSDNEPRMTLPPKFSLSTYVQLSNNHLGDPTDSIDSILSGVDI